MISAHDFRSRLDGTRGPENQYTARCPAHEDRNNSLSIKVLPDRILLKCHTGCDTKAILESLDLKFSDISPDNGKHDPPPKRERQKPWEWEQRGILDCIYDYTDESGTVLYQKLRAKPKDFAQRRPDPKDSTRFIWTLGDVRRVPYRLPDLLAATGDIYYVEGEKDAETLRAHGLTATTSGGANDWRPDFAKYFPPGSTVYVIPDSDANGMKHAKLVAAAIPGSVLCRVFPDAKDTTAYLESHSLDEFLEHCRHTPAIADTTSTPDTPFEFLGYRDSRYFLYSNQAQQIITMSRADLGRKATYYELAHVSWWETNYPAHNGGFDMDAAANLIIGQCRKAGIWAQERQRGTGAWFDTLTESGDRASVVHMGDRLVVNGTAYPIASAPAMSNVYTRQPTIHLDTENPAPASRSAQLARLCRHLPMDTLDADRLAGWIFTAPICGAMPWRPHIWITGASGSGKTWVIEELIRPILDPAAALFCQSSTTEAGLRARLGVAARPVVFDEAESEDERSTKNIQRVMELARAASSATSSILKGSSDHAGIEFQCRSQFCFAAVGTGPVRRADMSRISILRMMTSRCSPDQYAALQAQYALFDPTGIVARAIQLIPQIRETYALFSRVFRQYTHSQRDADQQAALFAGRWHLINDNVATEDHARELGPKLATDEDESGHDEQDCLGHILTTIVKHDGLDRSIAELIDRAAGNQNSVYAETLCRHGIRVVPGKVLIAKNHVMVNAMLKGTPFHNRYHEFLARANGVTQTKNALRFTDSTRFRCIEIPISNGVETTYDANEDDEPPF